MALLFRLRFLLRSLAVLAAVCLALLLLTAVMRHLTGWPWLVGLAVASALLFVAGRHARRWVPRRTILELDFERGVIERPAEVPFAGGGSDGPLALRDVLDVLERARGDRRVVALLARIGSFRPGLAVAQELHAAILAFRASGKQAIAWAETLGEGTSATVEVYLASAFDEIHLQPSGEVGLDGVLFNVPFVRGALDMVGVEPQMGHRKEYKTAKYMFTDRSMNEPYKESIEAVMSSQVRQIVRGIASGRELTEDDVRALVEKGPFTAKAALEAGLVDALAYRDEVYDAVKSETKGRLLHASVYLTRAGRPHRKGPTIAVVLGVGTITRGKGRAPLGPRKARMGSDDVTAAIRKAARSKRVKAIVLRVSSPGGSAAASDSIRREVELARAGGTPVIVSMGNVAASGGYYVACGADAIVADPGTITGSIGVVWGKFYLREAWRKIGVDWDSVQTGAYAGLWSGTHPFDEAAWAKVEGILDVVYEDFTRHVSEGRGLSREAVEEVARGRVWTGEQAKAHGLVDHLGGQALAIERAKEAAGIAADLPVRLQMLPRPRRFGQLSPPASSEAGLVLSKVARLAEGLGLAEPMERMRMPPMRLSTDADERDATGS